MRRNQSLMESFGLGGYMGRVLIVDLTTGRIEHEPLSLDHANAYIGGRGLATRLFVDRVDPKVDSLSPENVLVIASSPVSGTAAPTAGRGHMVYKSPLTGFIGSSNCGGRWAVPFKRSGYDAVIIMGRAPEPVLLHIGDDGVTLESASELWGRSVHSATDEITRRESRRSSVLGIGPAGENLSRIAAVMNEKNRAYGRCGPGAVFGSKNLKAIVVCGTKEVQVGDEARFRSGVDQAEYRLKAAPATKRILKTLGTSGLVKLIDWIDMLPHRNFQDTAHRIEDLDKVCGEALRRDIFRRPRTCYRCPIACGRGTQVGDWTGEGPEFETISMTGPNCDIYDLEAVARANYLCNELGIDTISFGATMSAAMELAERGHLPDGSIDGAKLRFGNPEVLEPAARALAFRSGIGDDLAEGSARMCAEYGHPEYSMSVKGLELPAYDPRATFTQALGYATSPTGACHLRGGYAVSLAFFGGTKEVPRFSIRRAPGTIRQVQNTGIIQDAVGICRFTGFAFGMDVWARVLSGVTGATFDTERLEEIAERIANLERVFNISAGLTKDDDWLPERFLTETIEVAGQPMVIEPAALHRMREDYYAIRGWDKDGIPRKETLSRYGL